MSCCDVVVVVVVVLNRRSQFGNDLKIVSSKFVFFLLINESGQQTNTHLRYCTD